MIMLDPDATILDALVDLAVRYAREHCPRVNARHVRTAVMWIGNDRMLITTAWNAAPFEQPDPEDSNATKPPVGTDFSDIFWGWSYGFYKRLAACRGFALHPEAIERRAVAFASSIAGVMRYEQTRVLNAAQADRPPSLATSRVDRLLLERADGEKRAAA